MSALQERGERVPALEARPEQDLIDSWNLGACTSLMGDRDHSGTIPWRSLDAYASAYGLSLDESLELEAVLKAGLSQLADWREAQSKAKK